MLCDFYEQAEWPAGLEGFHYDFSYLVFTGLYQL